MEKTKINFQERKMTKKILFQGDSITDCGRSREDVAGFNSFGVSPGYPGMVAADLWSKYPQEYEVVNRGISGNRIVDLYARWKADCLNLKPDILSILIGVNDTWHEFGNKNGVEVPRYERIFRELLQWTVDTLPGVQLVLIEPFLGTYEPNYVMMDEVRERAAVVKKLAEEFNAIFIPAQSLFDEAAKLAPSTYWLGDGVHPTPAGHRILANAWKKAMGL